MELKEYTVNELIAERLSSNRTLVELKDGETQSLDNTIESFQSYLSGIERGLRFFAVDFLRVPIVP